jgi:hypothetical protein
MKNIVLAAAALAIISAPAFAAPEAFNVEVGPGGTLRSSPPSSSSMPQMQQMNQQGRATWTREAPASPSQAQMVQTSAPASEQAMPVSTKKKHHHKKKAAPAPAEGSAK